MDPQPSDSAREKTYTLRRGDESFGPYTHAELTAYMAAGNVVAGDALFDHEAQRWTTAGAAAAARGGGSGAIAMPATAATSMTPDAGGAATATAASGTNSLAIVSVVCGALSLAGCGFFTGIAAIILGSRHYAEASDARLARIGLVLGIIGTVLSVLATCAWVAVFPFIP